MKGHLYNTQAQVFRHTFQAPENICKLFSAFEDFPSYASNPGLNHMNDSISLLYRALKANAEFRQLFADHVHAMLLFPDPLQ